MERTGDRALEMTGKVSPWPFENMLATGSVSWGFGFFWFFFGGGTRDANLLEDLMKAISPL